MHYKMQIACLIVAIYYIIIYLRDTFGKNKMKCHPIFDWIMGISTPAIFFDGATAWSVNHLDTVPDWVNRGLHLCFLLSEEILILLVFSYFVEMHFGKHLSDKRIFYYLPGIASIIVTVAFIGELHFDKGETTNYSMGISVYAAFFALFFYFALLGVIVLTKSKYIEKAKRHNLRFYVLFLYVVLIIQIIFPEVLITAMLPVATLIYIYENYESANLRRLKIYNEEMVTAFATLVENRDDNTGGHIKRTKEYVKIIISEMLKRPEYRRILSKDYIQYVIDAAPMHDIGKIATPDSILQKPGKLTNEEYDVMKEHAAKGSEIIMQTFAGINDPEFLKIAYEVARYHHEKWNGKGYPEGLSGEDIPLHARIMAIADVFDAISSKRCYRDAMPLSECFNIIEKGAGVDFDPKLTEIFLSVKDSLNPPETQ